MPMMLMLCQCLLTSALRWVARAFPSMQIARKKKGNPGGENTMRCSALLFVRRKGNVWLRKAGYVCNVEKYTEKCVVVRILRCLAMCHPCIVRLTEN